MYSSASRSTQNFANSVDHLIEDFDKNVKKVKKNY